MVAELSRRGLFRIGGAAGAAAMLPAAADRAAAEQPPAAYRFFNAQEARFIEAAVDRLIPPDSAWPGAKDAGVPIYLDRQLDGAFGAGERMYRAGPWKQGTPQQGYQLRFTPAELYRLALQRVGEILGEPHFAERPATAQDEFLRALESGAHDLGGFSSAIFFETLLANTIEGYFADPLYGGNKGMAGWRMIGFPGAHAAYLGLYTRHGLRLEATPIGMDGMDKRPHPHTSSGR